jgi:hypothetical protein
MTKPMKAKPRPTTASLRKITVRLDPTLVRTAKIAAATTDRDLQDVVAAALKSYLEAAR